MVTWPTSLSRARLFNTSNTQTWNGTSPLYLHSVPGLHATFVNTNTALPSKLTAMGPPYRILSFIRLRLRVFSDWSRNLFCAPDLGCRKQRAAVHTFVSYIMHIPIPSKRSFSNNTSVSYACIVCVLAAAVQSWVEHAHLQSALLCVQNVYMTVCHTCRPVTSPGVTCSCHWCTQFHYLLLQFENYLFNLVPVLTLLCHFVYSFNYKMHHDGKRLKILHSEFTSYSRRPMCSDWLRAEWLWGGILSPCMFQNLFFSTSSGCALRPTQPLFPRGWNGWGLKL